MGFRALLTGKAVVALISTASKVQANVQPNAFRPIYYLGCKTSLTSAIKAAIDDVDPSEGRLVDLFAGTGSVAAALSAYRNVTTVDVQEYSRVICSAVLNPATFIGSTFSSIRSDLREGDFRKKLLWCMNPLITYEHDCISAAATGNTLALVDLLESPPLAVYGSGSQMRNPQYEEAIMATVSRLKAEQLWDNPAITVSKNFGGVYFSFQQAAMLDVALCIADESNEQLQDTLKACAISAASILVNTIGKQFAQPIRPRNKAGDIKAGAIKAAIRDRSLDAAEIYLQWLEKYVSLPPASKESQSLREDYVDAMVQHGTTFSVVYADPPYTRDHYSRFYHVLETMCLRDNPKISKIVKNGETSFSRGAYREDRHQSPFCIRSAAPEAFNALFKSARELDLPLVLSYSPHEAGDGTHPRVVSMGQIVDFAHDHYKRVEIAIVEGMSHNKLNRANLELVKRQHAEILLKCYR